MGLGCLIEEPSIQIPALLATTPFDIGHPDSPSTVMAVGVDDHIDVVKVRALFPRYFGHPANVSLTLTKGLHEMLQAEESVIDEICAGIKSVLARSAGGDDSVHA